MPPVFSVFSQKTYNSKMTKKVSWALFAFFAILIGIFPFVFLLKGIQFGVENTKDAALFANLFWKIGFYTHIPFSALALLIGWTQFSAKLRAKYLKVHRWIGKIYVASFLLGSFAGWVIAFYATGGLIPALGFGCLAMIAFYTTLKAYLNIRKGDVLSHQKMMMYSYACCFAGVTLRIWQPILMIMFHDFLFAYSIVAWMSWLPNLLVAYWIIRKKERQVINPPLSI
jgi:uncharacterized membrane protein